MYRSGQPAVDMLLECAACLHRTAVRAPLPDSCMVITQLEESFLPSKMSHVQQLALEGGEGGGNPACNHRLPVGQAADPMLASEV